jgi:plastocyanin
MRFSGAKRFAMLAIAVVPLTLIPSVSHGETSRVKATGSRTWSPDYRHVLPGSKIVWRNPSSTTHTLTSYGAGWDKDVRLTPDTRTSKTFRKGTYKYRCKIHSTLSNGDCNGMCGVIHVDNY